MNVVWSPLPERRAGEALEQMCRERPTPVWPWLARFIAVAGSLAQGANRRPARGFRRDDIFEARYEPFTIVYRVSAGARTRQIAILALISARKHPHYKERKRHHYCE
jgi:hypothetical protein